MAINRPNVKFGKINNENKLKSRRFVNKDGSVTRVNKVNNKTSFYSKFNKKKGKVNEVTHLSVEAKNIIKKYPEFSKFLHNFFINPKIDKLVFKNKKVEAVLTPYSKEKGDFHKALFKLEVSFLKENKQKEFFIKFSKPLKNRQISSGPEFLASKIFEKCGINTIKPHLAYFKEPNIDIMMYDFSNLLTLAEAKKKSIIDFKDEVFISLKLDSLEKYYEELNLVSYSKAGIYDYRNEGNIFVKKDRDTGDIKLYFSDLFFTSAWKKKIRDFNIRE